MPSPNIQPLNVLRLTDETGNIYKSIAILGIRSNQIASKVKAELNEKLAEFTTSADALEEVVENREQIEIAKHYEGLPKPTLLALAEFLNNGTYFELTPEAE
jgi:RNA polymerase Rpb6